MSAERPSLAVVVSTYEWPAALDAVLRSLSRQSDPRFEVVVTDDGSVPATEAVVSDWRTTFGNRLSYVWQADEGFRAGRARNRGALVARADYLVFLDGDCVPRRHFVRALRRAARPGWFVAANRLSLSRPLTERILREGIPIEGWSVVRWLTHSRSGGSGFTSLTPRDRRMVGRRGVPEFAPHDNAYCCIGVAYAGFEAVNGYDTRYVGWGDEDVDLAVRLRRFGLRCGHAGPSVTPLHLWHPSRAERERENWWLLQETERSDRTEAIEGLREVAADAGDESLRAAGTQVSANRVGWSSSSSEPVNS